MGTPLTLADQVVPDPVEALQAFRQCWRSRIGAMYLDAPTEPNMITVADVGVSLLMNSRADNLAARTVYTHGAAMSAALAAIPQSVALQDDRAPKFFDAICDLVDLMTSIGRDRAPNKPDRLPTGIGISMATKIAHRKRPGLIPILDNDAIFALFTEQPEAQNAIGASARPFVRRGLESIRGALSDYRNEEAWSDLTQVEPVWSRLQCFDAVWWVHSEPARRALRQDRDPKHRAVTPEKCHFHVGGACPRACLGADRPVSRLSI
jgi:hypothetical protein